MKISELPKASSANSGTLIPALSGSGNVSVTVGQINENFTKGAVGVVTDSSYGHRMTVDGRIDAKVMMGVSSITFLCKNEGDSFYLMNGTRTESDGTVRDTLDIARTNKDLPFRIRFTGTFTADEISSWGYLSCSGNFSCSGNAVVGSNMTVRGTLTASVTTTSDIRLKDILAPVDISLDQIANAPVFTYNRNDNPDLPTQAGTSAQYWQEICPELVSVDGEGHLSLNYSAAALAAVVNLAGEVKRLNDEVNKLKPDNDGN